MKKTISLLSIMLFTLTLLAQVKKVEEITDKMSQGNKPGFKVLIPESTKKDAIRSWGKLMKEYDAKINKIKGQEEFQSLNATMPAVSDRPVVVYAQFTETPEGVYLYTYFDLGGAFLNSDMHPEQAAFVKGMLQRLATDVAKSTISNEVKQESKKLAKLEKELEGLEKAKASYEKDIRNANETITKRENDLAENAEDQAKKQKEIAEQKEAADAVKKKLNKF
jgi:DNA gyrase/topoisomerase IV subunit A